MTSNNALSLSTERGVWRYVEHHVRAGGDVDVILAFRPDGGAWESTRYAGFRRSQGEWRGLNDGWRDRAKASAEIDQPQLVGLLDTVMAVLPEFPALAEGDEVAENDTDQTGDDQ